LSRLAKGSGIASTECEGCSTSIGYSITKP
jgi:hypothetical protein